jgi:SAM-dependent methyltransferase
MTTINNNNLEEVECPMCGSEKQKKSYDFAPFFIRKCLSCSFFYMSPRLSSKAIGEFYKNDSYFEGGPEGYDSYQKQEKSLRYTFRRFLKDIENKGLCGGSLLEVGSGHGFLLDEARHYFNIRKGTDFSQKAVNIASQYADQVYCGGIESVPKIDMFDCIIATHVIEHVYDPIEFVSSLMEHLNDNGKLILAAPDMGGLWRLLLGKYWPSFKIPEHVQYFDFNSLSSLLDVCGLDDIHRLPYQHAFPLPLVASKFKLPLPEFFDKYSLWISGTTVAIYGVKSE